MRCTETLRLLDAYVDGELDPSQALALDDHLKQCATCRDEQLRIAQLKELVRSGARYQRAPASLRAALTGQIGHRAPRWRDRIGQFGWVQHAVAYAAVAALASGITLRLAVPSAYELTAQSIVASHTRALMAQQIASVASSDQHTVKPWFNGKIDFTPPVYDLAQQGFPLVGGRVDYVNQRVVAALVYQRRRHYIDVYVWPNDVERAAALHETAEHGFTVLSWSDREFTYFTISDVNSDELHEFVSTLGAAAREG